MKKLAIKNHPTRGKEVIELLEMMGGKNTYGYTGDMESLYFSIYNDTIIYGSDRSFLNDNYVFFTLEEFLEKFPYKVGDKVNQPCRGCVKTITSMEWDEYLDTVSYKLDNKIYTRIEQLKVVNDLPYKKTNMKPNKCTQCVYAVNNNHCGLRGFRSNFNVSYCSAQNVDKLPNGFELQEDGYFSWVNKKPKYPTTFEECLNMLYCKSILKTIIGHKAELLLNLEKLLICRDVYWKILGEETGLDKSWESDWTSGKPFYCISVNANTIGKGRWYTDNKILAFPTEEIRDIFYENFKDLIESCKELL